MNKTKDPDADQWDLLLADRLTTVRRTWLQTQNLTQAMCRHLLYDYSAPKRNELIDRYRTSICCWDSPTLAGYLQQTMAPKVRLHFDKITLGPRKHKIADEWLTAENRVKAGKPIAQYQDDIRKVFADAFFESILGRPLPTDEEARLANMISDTNRRLNELAGQCAELTAKLQVKP